MSKEVLFKLEITKSDEWFDVHTARRTSPTSQLGGMKRCSLDELNDYIANSISILVKEELRTRSWKEHMLG